MRGAVGYSDGSGVFKALSGVILTEPILDSLLCYNDKARSHPVNAITPGER